jgi:hypothetical protein
MCLDLFIRQDGGSAGRTLCELGIDSDDVQAESLHDLNKCI